MSISHFLIFLIACVYIVFCFYLSSHLVALSKYLISTAPLIENGFRYVFTVSSVCCYICQVNTITQPNQGIEAEGAQENAGGRNQAGTQGHPAQAFFNLPFQALHQSLQFPLQGAVAVPSLQMVVPASTLNC